MANRDDDAIDSVRTAELGRLIADSIGAPLSALCDRLCVGDSAWRQRVNFRDAADQLSRRGDPFSRQTLGRQN